MKYERVKAIMDVLNTQEYEFLQVDSMLTSLGFEVYFVDEDLAEPYGYILESYWIEGERPEQIFMILFELDAINKTVCKNFVLIPTLR